MLFTGLLMSLAVVMGVLPIIWLPIYFTLELGMANIFLCGYRGKPISISLLFEGFDKKVFVRNVGGLGWRTLWLLIWALIPFAGIVMFIIKMYSYAFVPYIMLNEPDISAGDALKKSMRMTYGYKGKMFLVNLLIGIGVFVLLLILFAIFMIPYVGWLISGIAYIIVMALFPLLMGIVFAANYDKVVSENPEYQ